jgi:hypothetical protein
LLDACEKIPKMKALDDEDLCTERIIEKKALKAKTYVPSKVNKSCHRNGDGS